MVQTFDFEIDIKNTGTSTELFFRKTANEKGIIYRLTAVLFVHGWNILKAEARTDDNNQITDYFLIEPGNGQRFDSRMEDTIRKDLTDLFSGEISVMHYLSNYPGKMEELYSYHTHQSQSFIEITDDEESNNCLLELNTVDRPGLLFEISQLLYLLYIDILAFEAGSNDSNVNDKFVIRREDAAIIDSAGKQRIREALSKIL